MNEQYSEAMYDRGLVDAKDLQARSAEMDGTALYAEEEKIPDFAAAVKVKNMLERPVGFVCKSSAGRVVKLLQVYDSNTYPAEPEELPAQWGFKWSTDPAKALPFVAISTSPYMKDDCCSENGVVYRSMIDNNVWAPSDYPQGWKQVNGNESPTVPPVTEPEQGGAGTEEPEQTVTSYPEFVHPTGAHDTYRTGDRVTYNGTVYESLIDNNSYSPDEYPQGWKAVE